LSFSGFSQQTIPFLKSIRNNNNKEWFSLHKMEYEQLILNPSRLFVTEMGEHLMALEPTINFFQRLINRYLKSIEIQEEWEKTKNH